MKMKEVRVLTLLISRCTHYFHFASKDSGKYSSYLSRSLSGTTVAGSNSEGAKWHLNRSRLGMLPIIDWHPASRIVSVNRPPYVAIRQELVT